MVEAAAGGVLTYLRHVLPALTARGCRTTLFWSSLRADARLDETALELAHHDVALVDLPMHREMRPGMDLCALWRLVSAFVNQRFDLVHTHGSKAGLLGRLAARLAGLPAVHTPHCFSFLRQPAPGREVYLRVERLLGRLTERLVAVSADEMRAAVQWKVVPACRCVCVNNGLPCAEYARPDAAQARKLLGLPQARPVVSMATRLVPEKGVMEFIEAARCSRSKALFVLAGEGPMASSAAQRIAGGRLNERVLLLGHVRCMDMLYAATDVAVLLSRSEGQPYSLIEAMRAGCAVVASNVSGISCLIEHGRTGLLVGGQSRSPQDAIDRLLEDDALRGNLGRAAQDHVRRCHNLRDQISGLLAVYQACTRSPRNLL